MIKLKIHTNKKTGQRTVFLPKKEFKIISKETKFLVIDKKKMRFI